MTRRSPLFCALAVLVLSGCGPGRPSSPVLLTAGDGCGDVYFWAATDSGDIAVTVSLEARGRSSDKATTLEFVLPSPTVAVEVLDGDHLDRNFCTDVFDGDAEPRRRQAAVSGTGTVTLDPLPEGPDSVSCGSVAGELELRDLEAEDGTLFAPIRVSSDSIGCYSG